MSPQAAADFVHAQLPGDSVIISLYASDSETLEVMHNLDPGAITLSDPAYQIASEIHPEGSMMYTGRFFAD